MAVGPGTTFRCKWGSGGMPRVLEGSSWGSGSVYDQGQGPSVSLGTGILWTKPLTVVLGMTLANCPAGLWPLAPTGPIM